MTDAGEVEMMTEEMIGSDPRSRRLLKEMKISSFQKKKCKQKIKEGVL